MDKDVTTTYFVYNAFVEILFPHMVFPQDMVFSRDRAFLKTKHRYRLNVAFPMRMFHSVPLEIHTHKLAQQYSFVTHVSLSNLPSVCW